ncbi:MAG: 2-C-methyl-D-erythritol 2,4-cyclodiphosphate synthase [Deltaproteobacteria bacterium]|nr:2-C-methyl-D-erythritol 2,4-cyclodiphosphate synthase [Deltaproteobacteria bacterium]
MGTATKKQFLSLGGSPVLLRTIQALSSWDRCRGILVVAPPDDLDRVCELLAPLPRVIGVVPGGEERQDSVRLGLEALEAAGAAPDDLVLVHDGVRPFPPVDRFTALCEAARPDGALLALRCRDTLKREADGRSAGTVDRSGLWQAQTPQAFPVALLRGALARAAAEGRRGTDEASLVEALGRRPMLVEGTPTNIKVTTPEDLSLAASLAKPRTPSLHIGHGYDVHRLVEGRKLVLGGVEIAHERGLLGHSDADVLAHAVADACLGAAGLGDLGRHFPDTDPAWAGASSLRLLELVAERLDAEGFRVLRVDATLAAQKPKIAPFVPAMEANLSRSLARAPACEVAPRTVTVKATTTEGLGFEGRLEGMSAHAVALLEKNA